MLYSPLRYPGGKGKITPLINLILGRLDDTIDTYVEPFAGGAGVALALLIENRVKNIVINDKDKAVYSFWRAILEETNAFIDKLRSTPITVDEWYRQKNIYLNASKYSLELGFSAFFLNRANRSGILSNAGPIGGYGQSGKWKITSRFNKETLIQRIRLVAQYRKNIKFYNKDVFAFIERYVSTFSKNCFVYFDPPYYVKGKCLYYNSFLHADHERLASMIAEYVTCPWIITYDNVPEITTIYQNYHSLPFDIDYSLSRRRMGSEVIIFKERNFAPQELLVE